MANAKRLPSGSWRVLAYGGKDENGKKIYKSFTAPTKRQAEKDALNWVETKQINDRINDKGFTVKKAMLAYIAESRARLSPTTIITYTKTAENHFADLRDIPLDKLTVSHVRAAAQIEMQNYAPKTVHNDIGFLLTVLKRYKPELTVSLKLPEVYPTVKDIPLDDDLKAIIEGAQNTLLELPVLLGAWLGLRMSEIRGLKYKDIKNGKLTVCRAVVDGENGAVEKSTKTKSSVRVLPLPEKIEALIGKGEPEDHIVTLSSRAIYHRFVRLCERLGLPHYTFHSLRHANATIMLDAGIPDKYIKERGGWGSDIYKRRYQHTTAQGDAAAAAAVDSAFKKIMQG